MSNLGNRFRVKFALWPVRLATRHGVEDGMTDKIARPGRGWWDFIPGAYVWGKKAYMVKNDYHGWIAFLEDQTEKNLSRCPHCNRGGKIDY